MDVYEINGEVAIRLGGASMMMSAAEAYRIAQLLEKAAISAGLGHPDTDHEVRTHVVMTGPQWDGTGGTPPHGAVVPVGRDAQGYVCIGTRGERDYWVLGEWPELADKDWSWRWARQSEVSR